MTPSGTVKRPSFWRDALISFVATVIVGTIIVWAVLPEGAWPW